MARLYDRVVQVTVNTLKFSSAPSEPERRNGMSGLHIAFRVERSKESKNNKAEAAIENLSATSQGKITVPNAQFIIEAGYAQSIGILFTGTAVLVSTKKNAVGFITTVKAHDGFIASKKRIAKSFAPGASPAQVIAEIVKAMGLPLTTPIVTDGRVTSFTNGIVLSGSVRDELDKMARTCGFEWSIQNEQLQILLPKFPTQETAIVLGPTTGLIDSPERIYDKKRPKAFLVRAKSLMQGGLMPGRQIALQSNVLSGAFKIEKATHTGDSRKGEFSSVVEAIAL